MLLLLSEDLTVVAKFIVEPNILHISGRLMLSEHFYEDIRNFARCCIVFIRMTSLGVEYEDLRHYL